MTAHPCTDIQTWENKLYGEEHHHFLPVDITCHIPLAPGVPLITQVLK